MQPDFQLHGCPIFIAPLEQAFPKWIGEQRYSKIFILVDEHTERNCLSLFLKKSGIQESPAVCVIPAGEQAKHLDTCRQVWTAMQSAALDREALVINLGGGVIGDLGGFCAATWKRGLDFVQAPTTLLSMTDAAIGGKLGIDFQGIKNAIGLIRQPAAVFIDPVFLHTLPERERRSGMAEIVKHGAIAHSLHADWVQTLPQSTDWLHTLRASVGVKVRIVQEDPEEEQLRMLLNFGHTVGHALESYFLETEHPLTHGEAIAIGMICESYLQTPHPILEQMLLRLFQLPPIPSAAGSDLWSRMLQDKKNASGKVRLALPDARPFELQLQVVTAADLEKAYVAYNRLLDVI